MEAVLAIAALMGLALGAGGLAAYFRAGAGEKTISLLQTNEIAYKEAIQLKDQKIAYLEAKCYEKDQIIKKLVSNGNDSK